MAPSVRPGDRGREVREQRRPEHIGSGDDRAAGGLGQQLAAHPLTGRVLAGAVIPQRGAGLPQPLVDRHRVAQRVGPAGRQRAIR